LASALAFAAPYALAEEAKPQADYGAAAHVELMSAIERLRMLDEIGEVTVVKLQPGQTPESADLESDKMTGAETSDTADAAAGIESDAADSESEKMESVEAGAAVDERIASGFEASGAELGPAGADSELASGKQTGQADLDSDSSKVTSAPSGDQAEAGALVGGRDQVQTGNAKETSDELRADVGQQQHLDTGEAAGAVSTTVIEDTVNQMPEIKQALEDNDAEAADIVSIDIDENGKVTIFVRES
jgi:hypothetical protein